MDVVMGTVWIKVHFFQEGLNNCMFEVSWDTARLQGIAAVYNRNQAWPNTVKCIFEH